MSDQPERLSTPSPAAPWQAVPKEPTPEMVREALATVPGICDVCEADIEDVYATMLAAAPSAPDAKSEIVSPSPVVTEEELAEVIYECDGLDGSWGYAPDDAKERSRYEARTVLAYLGKLNVYAARPRDGSAALRAQEKDGA